MPALLLLLTPGPVAPPAPATAVSNAVGPVSLLLFVGFDRLDLGVSLDSWVLAAALAGLELTAGDGHIDWTLGDSTE